MTRFTIFTFLWAMCQLFPSMTKAVEPDDAFSLNGAAMMMDTSEISLQSLSELCMKHHPIVGKELFETFENWKKSEQRILKAAKEITNQIDSKLKTLEGNGQVSGFMAKSTLQRRTQLSEVLALTFETLGEIKDAQLNYCIETNKQYANGNDRNVRPKMYYYLETYLSANDEADPDELVSGSRAHFV